MIQGWASSTTCWTNRQTRRIDLTIHTKGDLQVDEHHTVEDTAIALGEALLAALGNQTGLERYGFCLPMDDSLCQVALAFGGRPGCLERPIQTRKGRRCPHRTLFTLFQIIE
jgi:imidazoleglycerol phosphate dehydratase HisB